jgi:hypothetical protein
VDDAETETFIVEMTQALLRLAESNARVAHFSEDGDHVG